jgi:hypothetical protein
MKSHGDMSITTSCAPSRSLLALASKCFNVEFANATKAWSDAFDPDPLAKLMTKAFYDTLKQHAKRYDKVAQEYVATLGNREY